MPQIPPEVRENAGINNEHTQYEHPAFGYIRITRPQGGDPNLFMSSVKHDTKVSITIGRATMERAHHHDRHYARNELITIEMSTVQFADLMSGMNTHGGVPCTIRRLIGEGGVPGIDMEGSVQRYSKEVKETFKDVGAQLSALAKNVRDALEEAKVSKAKQGKIVEPVEKLARDIGANMPFMAEMFQETVEKVVQEAKAVVESYATERGLMREEVPLLTQGPTV